MKIDRFKKYFCMVLHLVLFTGKKTGEINKNIFKQISLTEAYSFFHMRPTC